MPSQINHGDTGPLWKPAKTEKKKPKPIKAKSPYKWLKTRKSFLKDKADHQGFYTCEWCSRKTQNPEVDHIQTRGARADLIHDPSNLRVLCSNCHRLRHGQKFH